MTRQFTENPLSIPQVMTGDDLTFEADEIAKRRGLRFNYITSLLMVDNFLPNFDMNDEMRKDKKEDRWIEYIKLRMRERIHDVRYRNKHVSLSDIQRANRQ